MEQTTNDRCWPFSASQLVYLNFRFSNFLKGSEMEIHISSIRKLANLSVSNRSAIYGIADLDLFSKCLIKLKNAEN